MFNDSQQRAYRSIAPSPDLKKRIMQMQPKPSVTHPFIFRKVALVAAACFVIVAITVISFLRQPYFLIEMDGDVLSENPTAVATQTISYQANTRTIRLFSAEEETAQAIPLHITIKNPAEISVSGGFLLLFDAATEQFYQMGENYAIEKSITIYWAVDDCLQNQTYTMTMIQEDVVSVLSLMFNSQTKQWELTLNQ